MKSLFDIRDQYYSAGLDPYIENVSHIQHAVQTARLAEESRASDAQIAACLLHDIGYLAYKDDYNQNNLEDNHELIGADMLSHFFTPDVTEPIRLHVQAKRYICSTDNDYYNGLSDIAKNKLNRQGGLFNSINQIKSFENQEFFKEALQLQQLDELARNSDDLRADFDDFIPLLKRLNTEFIKSKQALEKEEKLYTAAVIDC